MPRPSRRDEIVASAIALLDDDGLDGLSMRRLSEVTGASATSVYWYAKSKVELVSMTLDSVIAEVELPDVDALGWREAAAEMARGFRATVLRHPWLGLVAASYPTAYGPQLARHNEHLLAIYEAAGFDADDADRALATVYAYVLGSAVGEAGTSAWRSDGRSDGEQADSLARARAAAEGMPRLTARLDALEHRDPDEDAADFEFGLQSVLDGLGARLAPASRRRRR